MGKTYSYTKIIHICLALAFSFCSVGVEAKAPPQPSLIAKEQPEYTINFQDVSVLEFLKFISQISDTNFIYKDEEMNFNVTITSEEPTSLSNIMTALIQVLRIQGFELMEQGPNLLIHKNAAVKQIATVVSDELPYEGPYPLPIATRVFRIHNSSPTALSLLLKPMISTDAIIEPSENTSQLIITDNSANIEKIQQMMLSLDAPNVDNILLYRLQYKGPLVVQAALKKIAKTFEKEGFGEAGIVDAIRSMRYIDESNSILFTGGQEPLKKIDELLKTLDSAGKPTISVFAYKPKYRTVKEVEASLEQIAGNLKNAQVVEIDLLFTIKNMKVNKRAGIILFMGDDGALAQLKELLPSVDAPSREQAVREKAGLADEFLIYNPKARPGKELLSAIDELAEDLKESELADPALLYALESVKWEPNNNALIFTGNQTALVRVGEIIQVLDLPTSKATDLYVHRLQYVSQETMEGGLKALAQGFPKNSPVAVTIKNMKWLPKTHSLAFRGPPQALTRIKEVVATIDTPMNGEKESSEKQTYVIYKLQNVPGDVIIKDLDRIVKNLKSSDLGNADLLQTLQNVEWIKSTNSLYITGSPETLTQVQDLITEFDVTRKEAASNFFLYKPKYKSPKEIQRNLVRIGEDLQKANLADPALINTITTMRFETSSNSLIFTGTLESTAKIKELLTQIDLPKEREELIQKLGPITFLVYNPTNISADQLMRSLRAISSQIDDSNKPDKALVKTIQSMRYVEETKSVIFTGPEETLERLETLLQKFDSPALGAAIQSVGGSTFFVYQPRYVSVKQLMASLETISADMERSSRPDQSLIETLTSMRYVPDSKSLVFTGPEATLEKVQQIIEKFDNPSLAEGGLGAPEGYVLYNPKYQHGEELIETMKDFEKNLVQAGINQKPLFDVINNLKWMEKTCSILVSGNEAAVQEAQQLLVRFDVPIEVAGGTEIETIDDVSFLIYKLQYHRGDQIEMALKKVAADLQTNQAAKQPQPTKEGAAPTPPSGQQTDLIEAINSIQWLEITNSLIGTGKPQVLSKLKELLKSLDAPLRQVFIEILVIQTILTDDLDLGLRWGSQGRYRNKFGYGTGSFPSTANDPAADFNKNFAATSATNTPTGQDIPIVSGWDLGVIGDIIMHKGQSYFSLGSFVNAAKVDGDISIILTQQIITQDGKNSTLFVGSNVPFTGSVVTNTAVNTLQTSNIEYLDIGISLSITPTLGDDDIVTLQIDEEITAESEEPGDSGGSSSDPTVIATGITTTKNTTVTTVAVPDRHFLALSGNMNNTTSRQRQSIPCLGGLPVIGLAFQSKTTNIETNNVIMFIKPYIIHDFHEYKKITDKQEEIYRDQAIPEEFDAAIDLVKTPEDDD